MQYNAAFEIKSGEDFIGVFRNVLESSVPHDYDKCAAGKIFGLFSFRKGGGMIKI